MSASFFETGRQRYLWLLPVTGRKRGGEVLNWFKGIYVPSKTRGKWAPKELLEMQVSFTVGRISIINL